jgi:hypothetical protein
MNLKRFHIAWMLALSLTGSAIAQERCGTVKHMQLLHGDKLADRQLQFEEWIRSKRNTLKAMSTARTQIEPYKIPVVIHVIHNGESIGNGANIPEAQILSQLKVLNEDFRRLNADAVNTPPEFAAVAGNMDIEFVLAKRNPDGLATAGINRVHGHRASWSINTDDEIALKALSYWPSEDYLNVWVCNMSGFIGYSQFPVSDLPGLEGSSNNAFTDGVVITYNCFGSDADGNFNLDPQYNKGRTTTHEIGHFFGLKHIWGDDIDQCTGTDHVDDTPDQKGSTVACPTHPSTTESCNGAPTMFQNFLDYTDDACMNLFTAGQMERMAVVIENSPRRKTLLTSTALQDPDPVPNDMGIRAVLTPSSQQCVTNISPSVQLLNYGNNTVTSVEMTFTLNGVLKETKTFSLNVAPEQTTTVQFQSQTLTVGDNNLVFEILTTNGVADGDASANANIFYFSSYVPYTATVPFAENFDSFPDDWHVVNPDEQITWEVLPAPRGTLNNKAVALNFFNYEQGGEEDIFYTPLFSLEGKDTAFFFLDRANAQSEWKEDILKIVVVKGCQALDEGVEVYDRSGAELSTTGKLSTSFKPQQNGDWERDFIDLSQFVGQSQLQLAFVAVNDYGNNLYLDNITVTDAKTKDIAVKEIVNPSPISCEPTTPLTILLENTGVSDVTSVTAKVTLNGAVIQTTTFDGLIFDDNKEITLHLSPLSLADQVNHIAVELSTDETTISNEVENNYLTKIVMSDQQKDVIPIRMSFEDSTHENWSNFNLHSTAGMTWVVSEGIVGNHYLHFDSYQNTTIGDEAWFVSPALDFRRAKEASVVFDMSYRGRAMIKDDFEVVVSTNCGKTFEPSALELPEFDLSDSEWVPQSAADWVHLKADLSAYAGKQNIRVAFKMRNSNGNNLYLDNIEFFLTDEPDAVLVEDEFNIFGYDLEDPLNDNLQLAFNLANRSDVSCQIINSMGILVSEITWLDVLNQIYDLPLPESPGAGVYFVRLNIHGKNYTTRILVSH